MNHPIRRPTYEEHIQHLFTTGDITCMSQAIDLSSYEGVKASAAKISEWIGSGRMPPPNTGRQWSPEKLQTFRNWATQSGYARNRFIRLLPSANSRIRRSIHSIEKDSPEYVLLKKAFEGMMARDDDRDDPTSYFNMAGIHWLPGPVGETFCRHHDDGYNPWHRAYLMAFEDALRSVEGCEDVTLPYWDILGEALPDWVFEEPFGSYEYAHTFSTLDGSRTYNAGDPTQRNSASQIQQNVRDNESNIKTKIGEALAASTWRGFNGWSDWPNQHEGIIRAHDNGHGACGVTIANQDVASFDPLFWFFHCNWDRLWWQWQNMRQATTLLAFQATVSGDTHWLTEAPDTLLAPFDVNAAEMIDLASWNVDYDHPPEASIAVDERLVASRGDVPAGRSFSIAATERYSIRVKNINRLNIPGSFEIVLYSDEKVLDRTRIFQPTSPMDCENCRKHGVFNTDFIVDRQDITNQDQLRVAIEFTNASGKIEEFPISEAGNPTVNIRLLLNGQ